MRSRFLKTSSRKKRPYNMKKQRTVRSFHKNAEAINHSSQYHASTSLHIDVIRSLFSCTKWRGDRSGIYRVEAQEAIVAFYNTYYMEEGEDISKYIAGVLPFSELIEGGMARFYAWRDTLPKEIYTTDKARNHDVPGQCPHGILTKSWCSICQPAS